MTLRAIVFILALLAGPVASTTADQGDRGPLPADCAAHDEALTSLCQIVLNHFKKQQAEYVHLGGPYYFVTATVTGRVAAGVYVVNIATEEIKRFGGYGYPTLNGVTKSPDEPLRLIVRFTTMSRGNYAEGSVLYHVRQEPVTGRQYIVSQIIDSMDDASEELHSFCSRSDNAESPACRNKEYWGKRTVYLNRGEIDTLYKRGQSLDAYQTQKLTAAHNAALATYKREGRLSSRPFQLLEKAGVRSIIDKKPESMSIHRYVNILNDYAFFAYKYGEGRTELAIEILHKVIKLSPNRKAAYLNMADALEYSIRYSAMPISAETMSQAWQQASSYRKEYNAL